MKNTPSDYIVAAHQPYVVRVVKSEGEAMNEGRK